MRQSTKQLFATVCIAMMASLTVMAENVYKLVLELNSGETQNFVLTDKPKLTFDSQNVYVTGKNMEATLPFNYADIKKFYFTVEEKKEEKPEPVTYTISVSSADNTMGTVTGGGKFEENSKVTLTAIPNTGYEFKNWSDKSTLNPYEITVTSDQSYIAYFAAKSYKVTFLGEDGKVITEFTLPYGDQITVPAAPVRDGYTFSGWVPNVPATVPAENTSYTATYTKDPEPVKYTITAVASDPVMGEVLGSGTYVEGTTVELMATANRGYKFAGWSDGKTENPYSVTVSADLQITANFAPQDYTVTFLDWDDSEIKSEQVTFGSPIAAPENPTRESYEFAGWDPEIPETMPALDMIFKATYTFVDLIESVDGSFVFSYINNIVKIGGITDPTNVTVFSTDGKAVSAPRVIGTNSVNISLGGLPAGSYVVKTSNGTYKVLVK